MNKSKGLFQNTVPHHSPLSKEARAGTQTEQEIGGKDHGGEDCCLLSSSMACYNLLSYSTQDHQRRGSICPQWAGLSHINHQSRKFTMGPYFFFFILIVCVCWVLACIYMWRSEGRCFPVILSTLFWGRVCHLLWLTKDGGSQPLNARVTDTCVKLCHTWLRFASEIYF